MVGDAAGYNYARFSAAAYEPEAPIGPMPGQRAPEFAATTLDGRTVRLSDFDGARVVLETGSITCPAYVAHVPAMRRLARRHPNTVFLVLYTREAHPGGRIPAHASQAEKVRRARRLAREEDEPRIILVDDITGVAHMRYGAMPNSVHVLDESRRVILRRAWNDPPAVARALRREAAPTGLPVPRPVSPNVAWRVLRRAGEPALRDLLAATPELIRRRMRHPLRPPAERAKA